MNTHRSSIIAARCVTCCSPLATHRPSLPSEDKTESRRRWSLVSLLLSLPLVLLAFGLTAGPAFAQTTESATTTTGRNWTDATTWTCTPSLSPCVPNNTASNVFSVGITGGQTLLDEGSTAPEITIENLSVTNSPSQVYLALEIDNGESLTVVGNASNLGLGAPGGLAVDAAGGGGSSLSIEGNLTNTDDIFVGGYGLFASFSQVLGSTLTVDGAFDNAGGYINVNGGTLTQSTVTVAGAAPSTLTGEFFLKGGFYEAGAVLDYEGGGAITQIGDGGANAGNVSLSGPDAFIEVNGVSGNSALTNLTTIASNGSLTLAGASLTTSGALTNSGSLYVSTGETQSGGTFLTVGGDLTNTSSGSLDVDGGELSADGNVVNSGAVAVSPYGALSATGGYRQTVGTTDVDGTLIAPGGVSNSGGLLSGVGTIDANVVNGALVSPGSPVWSGTHLTIDGDYTQTSDGTLVIDISSATDYSVLDVTGTASLDGTVDFDFLNGYVPSFNPTFTFLDAPDGISGSFAVLELSGIDCSAGCPFRLTLTATTGDLNWDPPVPEPSSVLLLAVSLLALGWALWRWRPEAST